MGWNVIEGKWVHYKDPMQDQLGKLHIDHLDEGGRKMVQSVGKVQYVFDVDKVKIEKKFQAMQKY